MPEGPPVKLVRVLDEAPEQVAAAKSLFEEYAATLGVDLSFQNFAAELNAFPFGYLPPDGALFLALREKFPLGCVGVRRFDTNICEMKRLYVRDAGRGQGLGRRLCQVAMNAARELGFEHMRLDTLPSMTAAQELYLQLGFKPIAPYYHNPIEGTSYMEKRL